VSNFKQFLVELQHLHDVYADMGREFLEHLLNDDIAVNVKIDQMAFVVKREGDKLVYLGRQGKVPVTKSKRASMGLYEDAIKHVESRPWRQLPDNVEVYLEHFHAGLKSLVKYTAGPKHGLILSYLKKDGKIIRPDDPLNNKVAEILDVSPPPILFSGRLNEQQKKALIDFVSLDPTARAEKYGSKNFLPFVLSLFTHPQELDWLKQHGYEGLVFYFGREQPISAKVVDPMFTQASRARKRTTASELTNYLNAFFDKYLLEDVTEAANEFVKSSHAKDTEDVYLEFISYLTAVIVRKHAQQLSSIYNHYKEEAQAERFASIAYNLLPSYMKGLTTLHWWAEHLFSTLSYLLKGKQKISKPKGITAERKELINSIIQQLQARGVLECFHSNNIFII